MKKQNNDGFLKYLESEIAVNKETVAHIHSEFQSGQICSHEFMEEMTFWLSQIGLQENAKTEYLKTRGKNK